MTPTAGPPTAPSPLRRLPFVLVACVVLGLSGTIFGLSAVLSWNEPLSTGALPELEIPPGEEEAWAPVRQAYEKIPEVQLQVIRRHRPSITALFAVDLVSSAVLLVGALLARRRTASALKLLLTGLVLSQGYAALKLAIQTWVQLDLHRALKPTLELLARQGEVGATTAQVTLFAQSATIVVMGVVALVELGFYVYAHRYLRRPEVTKYLTSEG